MSSAQTPNLGLHRWAGEDYVKRDEFNDNFTIIDDTLGKAGREEVTKLQRQVAYLELQQNASDRINAPNTFADDLNGNSFGITFDEASSTNIVQRDGGLLMLKGTQTTETVTDATVVDQAYDTSGNGGRKLVRLSNGWFVSAIYDSGTGVRFYVYKPDANNIWSWSQLCYIGNADYKGQSLVSKDNTVYAITHLDTGTSSSGAYLFYFDATTITNTDINSANYRLTVDTNQSGGVNSVDIELNGNYLEVVESSKNSTYPNSFNIRYAKGTINADFSVTWGAVEQVTTYSNSTYPNFATSPSIILYNNVPVIIIEQSGVRLSGTGVTSQNGITVLKKDLTLTTDNMYVSSDWSFHYIYTNTQSYTQASPSAIFVPQSVNGLPNGRIWGVWRSQNASGYTVAVAYSDDGGVTWSDLTPLESYMTNDYLGLSLTANAQNEIFVIYSKYDGTGRQVFTAKNSGGIWGASYVETNFTSLNDQPYPTALFDNTFTLDFSEPLFIYMDSIAPKVGFYGTWTVGTESPTLTATAVYDLPSTDYVGAFVQREGKVEIDAYINDVLMDESLEDNEYEFIQSLDTEAAVKLRLELSRADTSGGNSDKVTRILGGIS
jgi:hypothetical protein